MDAGLSALTVLHIASDLGWRLLGIAVLLIISGRRDRRSFADESPGEARAEPLN